MGKRRGEGERIPADWTLDDELMAWSLDRYPGLTRSDVFLIAETFLDYWLSESGVKAYKCDWSAAFRNWMRRAAPEKLQKTSGGFVF